MAILLIAEHDNQKLSGVTKNLVSAALNFKQDIHVLVAGSNCKNVASETQFLEGITQVILVDNPCYADFLAENLALLISKLATNYGYILAPATTFGKNILPRVAGLLDVEQISDVVQILSPDTFVRPIYAGNMLCTIQAQERIKLLTIRKTAFAACDRSSTAASLTMCDLICDAKLSKFIKGQSSDTKGLPDLSSARIIVSGGRGLKTKQNFALLEQLAKPLNAAIGASRAAVDAGFISNDCQIGQTGKVVAPDLYFAIGISGAIQHIAGMKDSKVIVAINIDPNAPIFKIADYGLVGDLFKFVPLLIKALHD